MIQQTEKRMDHKFIAEYNRIGQEHIRIWNKLSDQALYRMKKELWIISGMKFLEVPDELKIALMKAQFAHLDALFK